MRMATGALDMDYDICELRERFRLIQSMCPCKRLKLRSRAEVMEHMAFFQMPALTPGGTAHSQAAARIKPLSTTKRR
jgi:hypothetical protein